MPVWFTYVDESYDDHCFCLSAMVIRHTEWANCFRLIKEHRQKLKADYGIPLSKEIHARKLVAGSGNISSRVVVKWERSRIFLGLLKLVASLPQVWLFNVCLPVAGLKDPQMTAWDRLVNRLERTMKALEDREKGEREKLMAAIVGAGVDDGTVARVRHRLELYQSRAFVLADEGKEQQITRALRRMHVHNPIPSSKGGWPGGVATKNITVERIIEDPVFKQSERSYFIQLADCIAFALLKRESPPTAKVKKYGLDKMFEDALKYKCFCPASPKDPLGIVRK